MLPSLPLSLCAAPLAAGLVAAGHSVLTMGVLPQESQLFCAVVMEDVVLSEAGRQYVQPASCDDDGKTIQCLRSRWMHHVPLALHQGLKVFGQTPESMREAPSIVGSTREAPWSSGHQILGSQSEALQTTLCWAAPAAALPNARRKRFSNWDASASKPVVTATSTRQIVFEMSFDTWVWTSMKHA